MMMMTALGKRLRVMYCAAGAADRPVQEIKINNVVIHANPLAGA